LAVLLRVKRFHSCSKSKELPPFLFEFLLRDRTYIQQSLVCPKLPRDTLRRRLRRRYPEETGLRMHLFVTESCRAGKVLSLLMNITEKKSFLPRFSKMILLIS